MEFNVSRYFCVLLSFGIVISVEGVQHGSNNYQSVIQKRSIKDTFLKDDELSPHSATEIWRKVNSLEGSNRKMNEEIVQLSNQNKEFKQLIQGQNSLLETVVAEVGGLQEQISSVADRLSDFDKMHSPAENLLAFSNEKCGGELVGQSGAIVYSRSNVKYPSNCVWTVRAKNRAFIKVSMQPPLNFEYYSSADEFVFVLETIKTNATGSSNSSQLVQTKITRLEKGMYHVFSGPTIFIFTPLGSQNDIRLHLQFEGMGKLVDKDTFFTHETLIDNSGSFNSAELTTSNPPLLTKLQDMMNYTVDYATLVVSNFTGMAQLQVTLGNRECSIGDSFSVITDMMENNTAVTDCCITNCEGNSSLISYGSPFVILISKKFEASLNFTLTWVSDPTYPFSSTNGLQCGEILGGKSGTITYYTGRSIIKNEIERCIWVIVPQPGPTSSITISLDWNGRYPFHDTDLVYMMELTDANGKELPEAPKITRLRPTTSYEALSREVYIVLYSNSNPTHRSLRLNWSAAPTSGIEKAETGINRRFALIKSEDGSFSMLSNPSLTNNFYHVFISTPPLITTVDTSTEYHLELSQTRPDVGTNDCFQNEWSVFTGGVDGALVHSKLECEEPGKAIIHNADGLAIIVRKFENSSSKNSMNFKWTAETLREVWVEENYCGGVISGDKGILKYRHGVQHLNNERCVWLLHSPHNRALTLQLLSSSHFKACCDSLLVTTIDFERGTLRNDTRIINHENTKKISEESLLIIVFQSNNTDNTTGFSLQISSSRKISSSKSKYSYKLRHSFDPDGTIQFPNSEWLDESPDVYIFASSAAIPEESYKFFTGIDWNSGVFNSVNNSCSYDSLIVYEPLSHYDNDVSEAWGMRQQFPNRSETESLACPGAINIPEMKNIFQLEASSFLGIYKSQPGQNLHPEATRTQFSFDYYQKSYGCGGTLVGEFGAISYKEDLKYANNENCTWIIEVPDSNSIEFRLEKSDLEDCCDFLTVTSINANGNSRGESSKLTSANRTVFIRGPRALLRFTSDSAVTGSGFRLRYEKSQFLFVDDEKCGGLITGDVGILSYKTETDYFNNEQCVWLVHSPNRRRITLELIQDGFEACCDYLLVNTISPSIGTLKSYTTQISRANKIETFDESLVIIEFRSDAATRGRGFSLRFTATGNNSNPTYSYNPHHISEEYGTVKYPSSRWGGVSTHNSQIFVLAHSLNMKTDDVPAIPTTINWSSGFLKKNNESCEYDSFTFYSELGERDWLTRTRFPDVNDTLSCAEIVTLPSKSNMWTVPNSAFVVVFKASLSNQNINDSKFIFTYAEGVSCGGTYIGNSGTISYKDDQAYENLERCIWLIEAPQAETISFSLESNQFENCCDFITISSVDALSGVLKTDAVLRRNLRSTTVKGSVVIVTFSSDDSVIGLGFRLRFSTASRADRNFHTYHLLHQSLPYNEVAYHVEANQVVIFAYNPSSSIRQNARVNITAFRPQVDEMCNSDRMLIYNVYRRDDSAFGLTKNLSVSDVIQDESFDEESNSTDCSAFGYRQFSECESIDECHDAPDGGAVSLNTNSFLVVYTSVNVTGSLRFRGFALVSDSEGGSENHQSFGTWSLVTTPPSNTETYEEEVRHRNHHRDDIAERMNDFYRISSMRDRYTTEMAITHAYDDDQSREVTRPYLYYY